jgi:NHS family nucleoside permease-like MFS transporter
MPTLLGIVADKWISRGFMPFAIWSALTLWLAAQVTTPGECSSSSAQLAGLYANAGVINTISYYRLQSADMDIVTDFPPIRIWGTIGFILAMWGVSFSALN